MQHNPASHSFPTTRFAQKRILVGITGGIAAYKSCELIRQLVTLGAEVRAMMSASARQFITETTIESLCNYPVYSEMFPRGAFTATHHIHLADWAEAAIIAPATANIIGKMANGIGDDFVSTTLLALRCPVVIAPAMNSNMWFHPAVQRNVQTLKDWGTLVCEPEEGFLAEGYSGVGRLARLEYLVQYLYRALHPEAGSLKGKTVLITAGRTEEYIDPARMLTNRSTGKMGFALTWEAFARGASVILVHGPGNLTPPAGVEVLTVRSAEEMYQTVKTHFSRADIFISAAAIADYRPTSYSPGKIKKSAKTMVMEFQQTRDVLKEMSSLKKSHQKLVGFAVETDEGEKNARKKLEAKHLDLIVLNNPLIEGAAFGAETNQVTLFSKTEKVELEKGYKLDIAAEIFQFLLKG
jgi:phosphopantothenoylcysteine decarboxylase/phosphopantothenate--cysteine ligase